MSSRSLPLPSPGTPVRRCVGGFFPTSQCVHGFIRWILPHRSLSSVLDETSDHYTGTHRCLLLFLPHDHTRHYNAHVCTPAHFPVFFGLWLSSALVVTYYCLIISRLDFLLLPWFCVSPQSWVIIRVFGSASVRSSKLFSLSPFRFPTHGVLDEKALKEFCINVHCTPSNPFPPHYHPPYIFLPRFLFYYLWQLVIALHS